MRGKVVRLFNNRKCLGITPAYAGKSNFSFSFPPVLWDHPRLCGEKHRSDRVLLQSKGSPPPMRGKGYYNTFQIVDDGITPAYAGKR